MHSYIVGPACSSLAARQGPEFGNSQAVVTSGGWEWEMLPHSSIGMRLPERDLNTLEADWVNQWVCESRSPLTVRPEPLDNSFLLSVLKEYYKKMALGIGNLTLEGAHLTPCCMTVMFTSCSAAVAVSTDLF